MYHTLFILSSLHCIQLFYISVIDSTINYVQ
nr:MAG TPA: hypothetical protein [Caudoviricetes sp.]